jgi:hypothetical protein
MHLHHIHHHHTRPSDLHVIAVISNPVRYQSRIRLFKEFMEQMELSGVTLWVVEAVHRRTPALGRPPRPSPTTSSSAAITNSGSRRT